MHLKGVVLMSVSITCVERSWTMYCVLELRSLLLLCDSSVSEKVGRCDDSSSRSTQDSTPQKVQKLCGKMNCNVSYSSFSENGSLE